MCLQTQTSVLLTETHNRLELHGVAANPVNPDEIATSGDDGFVRVWSLSRRSCIRRVAVDISSRSLAWSNDGNVLIVGVGGDPSITAKDG